jgi:hypothetical protein
VGIVELPPLDSRVFPLQLGISAIHEIREISALVRLHVSIAFSIGSHHQQIALPTDPVKTFVPESDPWGFSLATSATVGIMTKIDSRSFVRNALPDAAIGGKSQRQRGI